ncbi:MAG: hypothetical protein KA198_04020, partial [Chitinophagaceae bacterium]|nr:hypothetical protein [Chitinophagaceae bacterium]
MIKYSHKLLLLVLFLIGFSQLSQAQYAPTDDFDGDGIINSIDIDDDNDGILDATESVCGALPLKSSMTVTSDIGTGGGILANVLDGTNTNNYFYANNATCVNKNLFEFTFPQAVNLTGIEIATSTANSFLRNTVTYRVEGWDGSSYIDLTGTQSSSGTATATTTGGNTLSVKFSMASNINSYTKYRIYGLTGTTNNNPYIREAFFTGCVATILDTDGDLISNQFELDSDNDGCADAFESGATMLTTANFQFPTSGVGANGLANSLETAIDNGILNYTSTYTTYATTNALNYCNLFQSAKGKVFMDFDGSSTQSSHTKEPGVKNVTVRAYKVNGNYIDAITDSLGEYSFTGAQIDAGEKVRIEFINLPAGFYDGFKGSGSNTTVQFVTGSPSANNANLALSLPGHFSSTTDPYFAVVNFKRNTEANTLATITFMDTNKTKIFVPNGATDINKEWATPDNATAGNYPIPTRFTAATTAQVGTTLGLAWNKYHKKLLTGAYMRGWTKMGSNSSANGFGEGVIYQIPINGTTVSAPTVWLDLETLLGDDIAGTYVNDANHGGNGVFGRTNLNPNKIGYTGLGLMNFSADGSQLYVVNLNSLEVFVIPIDVNGNPPSSSSAIKRFKLPTIEAPGNWPDGRPHRAVLGLGVHPVTGHVYASMTCTGPTVSDLKGVVYSFDPNDATPDSTDFVKQLEIPLDIKRPSTNPNVAVWYAQKNKPWETVTANTLFYPNTSTDAQYTHPWLGEIVFDALPDGTFGMTVAERNRYHDMLDGSWYITGGGLYRATNNGSMWALENNGIVPPLTTIVNWSTASSTRAGFNTSASNKFYKSVGREGTFGYGTLSHVPGSNEVFMVAGDNVFNSGTSGVSWLSTLNGDRTRDNRTLADFTANGYNTLSFNKSSNWGDVEMLTDLPSIEIGNLVWKDTDGDGIQDPNETGIAGIILELFQAGILVGTTTSDANGNYYFTSANVNQNGATGILPNTAYEIRVATNQTNLAGCSLTNANSDATPNGDSRDSDGSGSGTAVISLTTGNLGVNNHTYDIGFKPAGPVEPACLGDYVWNDRNKDGIQNNGEVGVAGITVTLLDDVSNVLSTTLTDAYGYYHFCPLDPGIYKVRFTLPANYVFTTANTANDSTDSDVNPLTGITTSYTLVSGDTNYTVDAGIHFQLPSTASVGNYVWLDINQDGIQDPSEEGISGVTVTLCNV